MDFTEAVQAHTEWKMKLAHYLKHSDGSIKPCDVESDTNCRLGHWIYGEGHRFYYLPEYSALKKQHAAFHKAAADVVRSADAGEPVSEELALGAESPYGKASRAVFTAISTMKTKVADEPASP